MSSERHRWGWSIDGDGAVVHSLSHPPFRCCHPFVTCSLTVCELWPTLGSRNARRHWQSPKVRGTAVIGKTVERQ